MKAKEIKEDVYYKLVRLDYSRKENDLHSVNSINWFDLEFEVRSTISTFPSREIDWNIDLMCIEDLNREQQFYLFQSEGHTFLVDTQGYTYPRYIVMLEGFDDEVESEYERIEGLTPITDVIIIEQALKSIVIDLAEEMFDQEQVQAYLEIKLEYMIKEAVATNVKSFR
jgi:hypothetical protein